MKDFQFLVSTKIIFGRNAIEKAGVSVKAYGGRRVLLHYGGGSGVKTGVLDRVKESLNAADITFVELGGVQPNPRLTLVYEGIELCKREDVDFILGVGGGSVIDSAKTIAAGVLTTGDVWDFFEGKAKVKQALPVGVVLTIPAAGSEASRSAVITKEDLKLKRDIISEVIRPKFAIMNPEVSFTLPADQTAYGVSDIMAHVIERYFTNVEYTELSDRMCEAVLKTVIHNLPIVLQEPENYEARAEIMWAGTLAHNGLLSTGRIGDWASHLIEHELSAEYDIAHGAGLSIIIPAWMKYVYRQRLPQFIKFAMRVWDVEYDHNNPERTALEGIHRLENFYRENGMPTRLGDMDIGTDRLTSLAERIKFDRNGEIGNLVKLNKDDALAIFNLSV